jgi:hypothetical protein
MAHNPSRADIIEARFSLQRRLPIELADDILHAAEYYARYSGALSKAV